MCEVKYLTDPLNIEDLLINLLQHKIAGFL